MYNSRIITTILFLFLALGQNAQTIINNSPKLETDNPAINNPCITIKPGPNDGKDVLISLNLPNNSYPYSESNSIYTWTNGGSLGLERSLIEFDFSSIPENAEIISSNLSLFFNPTDDWQSFDYHTGDNAAYIQRILNSWDQYSVTWNNKPATTTENQVWLSPSTSPTEDYLNIDVIGMVRDMLATPSESYGFSIKMENEQDPYRSLLFASSNHPNELLRPEIEVCWNRITDTKEISNLIKFNVFPNPSNGIFNFSLTEKALGELNYEVIKDNGQSVLKGKVVSKIFQIDLTDKSPGLYFIRVYNYDGESLSKKVLLQ